ncbi:MAG: AAA domain-containing protein [Bryobacterales bacterium]|nr:AAA domain-containing protein [Bryobacterales bacterium]
MEDAEHLSLADREHHRQVLDLCSVRLAGLLRAHHSLLSHPWYGVSNAGLDYFAEQALISLLQKCLAQCRELEAILAQWGAVLDLQPRHSVRTIHVIAPRVKAELPSPSGAEIQALLMRLAEPKNRGVLSRFLSDLDLFRRDEAALLEVVTDWARLERSQQAQLRDFTAWAAQLGVSDWDAHALAAWASRLEGLSAAVRETAPFVRDVLQLLEGELSFALDDVGALITATDLLLTATPFDALPLRRADLEQEAAAVAVRDAAREAAELRSMKQHLEAEFRLDCAPSVEELRFHIAVVESSGLWQRWFGRSYRVSKRCFTRIRKRQGRLTLSHMARGLQDIEAFCQRRAAFRTHSCWSFIGSLDRDIDAPWNQLLRLVDWYQESRLRLSTRAGFAGSLIRTLCATQTAALYQIAQLAESGSEQLSRLRIVAEEVRHVAAALPAAAWLASGFKPEAYAATLDSVAAEMRSAQVSLAAAGVRQGVRLSEIPGILERINELVLRKESLQEDAAVRAILHEHHAGMDTEAEVVASTLDLAERVAGSSLPPTLQAWLFETGDTSRFATVAGWCDDLVRCSGELETIWNQFERQATLDSRCWFRLTGPARDPGLGQMCSRLEEALGAVAELSEWLEYLRARSDAERLKLAGLLKLAEQGKFHHTDLVRAYDYAVYNCLARCALEKHPRLMRFSGMTHEKLRRDFVRLDEEVMHHYQARVACLVDRRPVPNGVHKGPVAQWSDLALIQKEITKTAHIPIRQLVARACRALLALKPCFMMGPPSVAQYLPPGEIEFDLVVMDEASQLKPEDAIGVIARGKQVVIVGDKQQLPPTTFFERAAPEEELSELEIMSAEEGKSILEVSESVFQPVRQLRWHYRSRHHSLIAFSNEEFYNSQLIVFPAAYTSAPDLGVRYIPVTNGIWDGRRNVSEAQRVVDAVLEHMERYPNESLGVATINFPQCELIDEMLDKEFQSDPAAQHYLEKWECEKEPFFVKNLENVQGDERDVIFISMTYGPDARGNFYQRFGPINAPKGHCRLNVLFTRAKKRTVVFSSMDPGSIRVDPDSKRGTKVLKKYLEYAKTGVLQQAQGSRGGPESDFETCVGQVLQEHGYEIATQVGVAGFFIDLALRHPRRDGAYLLGIECDGASYHAGRSARDRDRLRQMILENLGWKIHRIWSTDWYKFRQREVERLLSRIVELLSDEEREESLRRATSLEMYRGRQGRLQLETEVAAEAQAALKEDFRSQLVALKETIARDCPDTAHERRLLRDEMIDAFLQKRPTSQNDWLRLMPYELRSSTDLMEIRKYLAKVLEVFAEAAE